MERIFHIKEKDLKNLREKARKVKELEKKLEVMLQQIEEMKDKYLRVLAEFDNYRKRTEKEKKELLQYGIENYVQTLLPFDEIFEKIVKQFDGNENISVNSVIEGLKLLRKEFSNLLSSLGIKKIESVGKKFDPVLHEAKGYVETDEYPEGYVVEEERSGYMLNEKVIRPSWVKVAKKKISSDEDKKTGSGKD